MPAENRTVLENNLMDLVEQMMAALAATKLADGNAAWVEDRPGQRYAYREFRVVGGPNETATGVRLFSEIVKYAGQALVGQPSADAVLSWSWRIKPEVRSAGAVDGTFSGYARLVLFWESKIAFRVGETKTGFGPAGRE